MDEVPLGVFISKPTVHLDPIWKIRENGRVEFRFKYFQIGPVREAGGAVGVMLATKTSIGY